MDYVQAPVIPPCDGEKPLNSEFRFAVNNHDTDAAAWLACTAHPEKDGGVWLKAIEKNVLEKPTLQERLGKFCTGCAQNCLPRTRGKLDDAYMGGA